VPKNLKQREPRKGSALFSLLKISPSRKGHPQAGSLFLNSLVLYLFLLSSTHLLKHAREAHLRLLPTPPCQTTPSTISLRSWPPLTRYIHTHVPNFASAHLINTSARSASYSVLTNSQCCVVRATQGREAAFVVRDRKLECCSARSRRRRRLERSSSSQRRPRATSSSTSPRSWRQPDAAVAASMMT
jgi:hypothetical protein